MDKLSQRLTWRIYYWDGSTFDSSMGEPEDAPPIGVVVIVQPDKDKGRTMPTGWDYYLWRRDCQQWWGHNQRGMEDQFAFFPRETVALKIGGMVHDKKWLALIQQAKEDKDFAPRDSNAVYGWQNPDPSPPQVGKY